jgi:hypothetical protein
VHLPYSQPFIFSLRNDQSAAWIERWHRFPLQSNLGVALELRQCKARNSYVHFAAWFACYLLDQQEKTLL